MKGDPDTKYMVSSTHKFSDGTETVVNYVANPNQEEIEAKVSGAVASDHTSPDGIGEEIETEIPTEVPMTIVVEENLDTE